ncbi:hypothetical protein A3G69_03245 [Candidatus Peribacteria bacterium RIFCSPLOWO2_12_FULL_53_10]|nr:MAG: hypothetical protein A3G69_03245 [Candidatus Peribacteria bacterium RIFCSPLOWO2_12_FULL_53_10]
MAIRQLSSPVDLQQYDHWVKSHPQGTLWQSLEWKTYQEALGREVRIYADGEPITASALIMIDKTTFGWSTWDMPRGPLGKDQEPRTKGSLLLQEIAEAAKHDRTLSVYFSPQDKLDTQIDFAPLVLGPSRRSEMPSATRLIDLRQSEEQILAQMKQKGRYNIRIAQKHGVRIEKSNDIDAFARLAAETARRDGFIAPPASHYQVFLESLPGAFLLLAYSPSPAGEGLGVGAIAGLLGVIWPAHRPVPRSQGAKGGSSQSVGGNGTGIYYYGASDYQYRNLMAPYLLQWEAMKLCKEKGCHTYDLLGISLPTPDSRLTTPDSWSGITRFKEQFGGTIIEYSPEQQIILKPWANRLLHWKRKILG